MRSRQKRMFSLAAFAAMLVVALVSYMLVNTSIEPAEAATSAPPMVIEEFPFGDWESDPQDKNQRWFEKKFHIPGAVIDGNGVEVQSAMDPVDDIRVQCTEGISHIEIWTVDCETGERQERIASGHCFGDYSWDQDFNLMPKEDAHGNPVEQDQHPCTCLEIRVRIDLAEDEEDREPYTVHLQATHGYVPAEWTDKSGTGKGWEKKTRWYNGQIESRLIADGLIGSAICFYNEGPGAMTTISVNFQNLGGGQYVPSISSVQNPNQDFTTMLVNGTQVTLSGASIPAGQSAYVFFTLSEQIPEGELVSMTSVFN